MAVVFKVLVINLQSLWIEGSQKAGTEINLIQFMGVKPNKSKTMSHLKIRKVVLLRPSLIYVQP